MASKTIYRAKCPHNDCRSVKPMGGVIPKDSRFWCPDCVDFIPAVAYRMTETFLGWSYEFGKVWPKTKGDPGGPITPSFVPANTTPSVVESLRRQARRSKDGDKFVRLTKRTLRKVR